MSSREWAWRRQCGYWIYNWWICLSRWEGWKSKNWILCESFEIENIYIVDVKSHCEGSHVDDNEDDDDDTTIGEIKENEKNLAV